MSNWTPSSVVIAFCTPHPGDIRFIFILAYLDAPIPQCGKVS